MTCGAPESETGPVAYGVTHLLPLGDTFSSLHGLPVRALPHCESDREVLASVKGTMKTELAQERRLSERALPPKFRKRRQMDFKVNALAGVSTYESRGPRFTPAIAKLGGSHAQVSLQ